MTGLGLILIVILLQIGVSFAGARRFAGRGLGTALLPALVAPAGLLVLAAALVLDEGGFSEGIARVAALFAAVFLLLIMIGLIAAWAGLRQGK